MRRGPTWIQLLAATALVSLFAVASPALGGPSLRELVRKEVERQLDDDRDAQAAKKKKAKPGPAGPAGPAGAAGVAGTPGATGAAGTARAYAEVKSHSQFPCTPNCTIDHAKGISSVQRIGTGNYCVTAPGISPGQSAAVVSVEYESTTNPEGNASAIAIDQTCGFDFGVLTERQSIGAGPVLNSTDADDVGFRIVIP
jgi:hypothetical protein